MELDDDEPPSLVDVNGRQENAPSGLATQMQEVSMAKVPLTIVTGKKTPIQTCYRNV